MIHLDIFEAIEERSKLSCRTFRIAFLWREIAKNDDREIITFD